jgi:dolichol kinase
MDRELTILWLTLLSSGVGGCVLLHRWGLATTYVRDLLHIGTGIWVFGWSFWKSPVWPLTIVFAALAVTSVAPLLARSSSIARRVMSSFAAGDERWAGLILYAASFAALTVAGLLGSPFPAAAGLLALCLGDGLGGAAGRRFGRHFYRVPGGKRKSWEGSAIVAIGATIAVLLTARWFHAAPGMQAMAGLGLAAAAAEALAPRGTDNIAVPLVVWILAGIHGVG